MILQTKGQANRLGKFRDDLDDLEERMRAIRTEHPKKFSVKRLAQELNISNHTSSHIYNRILRNP